MDKIKLSNILSKSRYDSGKSQEYMAEKLNISKRTIANWESGTTFPNVYQTLAWFDALNINSTPYFLQFINQETLDGISAEDSDEDIKEALISLIDKLPSKYIRALLYLVFGSYGGDPESMINLSLANAHLPLQCRVTVATLIMDMYDMCESTGKLKDMGHIMPDTKLINTAIKQARIAAKNSSSGYQIIYHNNN